MLRLAGSAMIMTYGEFLALEIVSLWAGLISTDHLAASAALLNTISLLYSLPVAFALSAAIRIANLTGSNMPKNARISAEAVRFHV